jgi:catechol 2,3-dioxygenase-like lactoylglutathione lyase family enzyme
MIDHITVPVKSYEKSKAFYTKVLATLGYGLVLEPRPGMKMGGFGKNGKPDFWIGEQRPSYWNEGHAVGGAPIHIAFQAPNRAAVVAFHEAALAAGATDFGKPGPRPLYHEAYYGAFVLDPDGNNVEAVVHAPE